MTKLFLQLTPRLPIVLLVSVALLWSPFASTAFALDDPTPNTGSVRVVGDAPVAVALDDSVPSGGSNGADMHLQQEHLSLEGEGADTHLTEESILFTEEEEEVPHEEEVLTVEEEAPLPQETPAADTPLITEELQIETLLLLDEQPEDNEPSGSSGSREERRVPNNNGDDTETQTAPATALTAALATSTNSGDTTDAITSNTEIDIEISHASSYGGTSGDKVHTFYKQAACADVTIPSTAVTVAEPGNSWTRYGSGEGATTAGTTFTVTDGIALAQGTYCFYGAFANGTATSPTNPQRRSGGDDRHRRPGSPHQKSRHRQRGDIHHHRHRRDSRHRPDKQCCLLSGLHHHHANNRLDNLHIRRQRGGGRHPRQVCYRHRCRRQQSKTAPRRQRHVHHTHRGL